MSITDILIILGCLAGGYWLVSSVMGPGIDITRRKPPEDPGVPDAPRAPEVPRLPSMPHFPSVPRLPSAPQPRPSARPLVTLLPRAAGSHQHDWHVVLDLPRTANRSDIEAAFRQQRKKAEASGDALQLQRLQQAREAGLASLK